MGDLPLRILTLNTWKNEGDYPTRLPVLTRGLGACGADVVLLQECFRVLGTDEPPIDTAATLGAALEAHVTYAPARRKERLWHGEPRSTESGLAILAPCAPLRSEVLALPSCEQGGERIALFADYALQGRRLRVVVLHLSHLRHDDAGRRAQLACVLAHPWWQNPADLQVIGGDFNAPAASATLRPLPATPHVRLHDVFAGRPPCRETHPLPPTAEKPGRCIDFLYLATPPGITPPAVVTARLALQHPIDGRWASDHAGVMADIAF